MADNDAVKTAFDHLDSIEEVENDLDPIENVPRQAGSEVEEVPSEIEADEDAFSHLDPDGYGEDDDSEEETNLDADDDEEDSSDDTDDDSGDETDDTDDDPGDGQEEEPNETIPMDLVIEAGKAGLTAQQIRAFPNAESLQAALSLVPKSEDDITASATDAELDAFLEMTPISLDDVEGFEEFDEDTQNLFKMMGEKVNAQFESVQKAVAKKLESVNEMREQLEQTQQREFFEWYDNTLEGLGEDWQGVLGKGQTLELTDTSKEWGNRMKLTQEMDRLNQSHPEWNKKKLFDAALRLTFPSEYEKVTTAKARTKAADHKQTRVTQRPSSKVPRVTKTDKSSEKAVSSITKMLRGLGIG